MKKYICFEGVSGSGKTYLFNSLKEKYKCNPNYIFLSEIFDEEYYGLDKLIFSALYHTGNRFFDMGIPLTETMLLLTKKMYQYESALINYIEEGKIIIQDRGIDTVAIYQSILILRKYNLGMSSVELVEHIHKFIDHFLPIPDITILLAGDLKKATKRAETRDGIPYNESERELLKNAEKVYLEYANKHSERFIIIDISNKASEEILNIIEHELYERQLF